MNYYDVLWAACLTTVVTPGKTTIMHSFLCFIASFNKDPIISVEMLLQ